MAKSKRHSIENGKSIIMKERTTRFLQHTFWGRLNRYVCTYHTIPYIEITIIYCIYGTCIFVLLCVYVFVSFMFFLYIVCIYWYSVFYYCCRCCCFCKKIRIKNLEKTYWCMRKSFVKVWNHFGIFSTDLMTYLDVTIMDIMSGFLKFHKSSW